MKIKIPFLTRLLEIKEKQLEIETFKLEIENFKIDLLKEINKGKCSHPKTRTIINKENKYICLYCDKILTRKK